MAQNMSQDRRLLLQAHWQDCSLQPFRSFHQWCASKLCWREAKADTKYHLDANKGVPGGQHLRSRGS